MSARKLLPVSEPFDRQRLRGLVGRQRGEIEALKASEAYLKCVIEAAPNGLLMVNRAGKIVLCNAEIEALFGYSRNEIVGSELEILIPKRFRGNHPGYRNLFFSSPEIRQMGVGRDLFGLRKDGFEFPVEIGLNPLKTEQGVFVLASIVDITKRKALEDSIRNASAALQQKNEEMEQFVYTVSHDLKSPIVTSLSFIQFIREDLPLPAPEAVLDSLNRLERANRRMAQLIEDLMRLSRVGRLELLPEPLDMTALAREVWRDLGERFKNSKVDVQIESDMPHIWADKGRIMQLFENLFINAVKYGMPALNPRIWVGSVVSEQEVCFFVRDNGPGIAPEFHRVIFALFERLDSKKEGTGVGLAIVARVAQLHGGRVWVESSLGKGATFWAAFPNSLLYEEEER